MEKNEKNKNLSLQYMALVEDIEKQIIKLENLGFSMQKYRNRMKEIKEKIDNNSSQSIENNTYTNSIVNERQLDIGDLSTLYFEVISSLEEMKQEISDKYDAFIILFKDSSYLNECLRNIKNSENLVSFIEIAIDLLNKIECSPTSDYKQIKTIIDNAYKTVFNMMKLEALAGSCFSSESIFSVVKKNSIHSFFIAKFVQEECEKSQDPKVLSRFHQLETTGVSNSNLIDYSLFRLLAVSTDAPFVKPLQESTKASVEEYKKNIEEIRNQAKTLESSKKDYENKISEQRHDLFKGLRRASLILASLGIAGTLSMNAFKGIKNDGIKYRTISTEYDIQTGESYEGEDNGEYSFILSRNVSVLEESPWVYDEEKEKYAKAFSTYNLESNPRVKNPDEYVEMIKGNDYSTREFKYIDEKPDDFEKQITKYFVTIKEFDYDDNVNVLVPFALFLSALIFLFIGMCELLIYASIFDGEYLFIEDKYDPVIKDYLASRQNAIVSKKELEENIRKLRELIKKHYDLLENIKSISCYKELCPEVGNELNSDEELKEMVAQSAPSASLKKVFGK